jgi:hypothetical protein
MDRTTLRFLGGVILLTLSLLLTGIARQIRPYERNLVVSPSQTPQGPATTPPTVPRQDQRSDSEESEKKAVGLKANLVDAEKNSKRKWATVEARVKGVTMIDPAKAKEQPKAGQAHLHYQLDDGPVVATTSTKLSFHDLPSGKHKITVMLAANDHSPLGPEDTVDVDIP